MAVVHIPLIALILITSIVGEWEVTEDYVLAIIPLFLSCGILVVVRPHFPYYKNAHIAVIALLLGALLDVRKQSWPLALISFSCGYAGGLYRLSDRALGKFN